MSHSQKVLLVGLRSDVVDFDKWPQLSVDLLETTFTRIRDDLQRSGYSPRWCLVDTGETAAEEVTAALNEFQPDIVMVGAGVRDDSDHMLLFERLINIIHTQAPQARIAFNTNPFDSVEAVGRWT